VIFLYKHFIIPIFVPHLGCPHDCIFCNQKRIASVSTNIDENDVKSIIDEYLGYFTKKAFIEVAFYGGSFTAIDMDVQNKLLEVPLKYKKEGLIDGIRLSTRPDAISDDILKNLRQYDVDTIELGAQSMDQGVLNTSARGHSTTDIIKASKLIKKYNFRLGLQMMVGLPKSSLDIELKNAEHFINLEPDCVRIYPTLVIKDTYLEDLYMRGEYNPLDLKEAIEVCSILLMLFHLNNINVIRIGLQPTNSMQLGKDVKSGPFHPAFRQLVESYIYKNVIDYYLDHYDSNIEGKILKIKTKSEYISNIAGQNSTNKKHWIKRYNLKNIKFHQIDSDNFIVSIGEEENKVDLNFLKELFIEYYLKNRQDVKYGRRIQYR